VAAGGPRRSPAAGVLRAGVAVAGFWVFLVGALVLVAAFHPMPRLERRARFLALVVWAVPLLATPLLFGPEQRVLRVPAAIWSALLHVKLYDVHLSTGRGWRPDGWSFLSFLSVPLPLLLREERGADGTAPASARPWTPLIAAVAGSAIFLGSFWSSPGAWPCAPPSCGRSADASPTSRTAVSGALDSLVPFYSEVPPWLTEW